MWWGSYEERQANEHPNVQVIDPLEGGRGSERILLLERDLGGWQ